MKKILITYATAGEGHKKAALAIKSAFDILNPRDTEIKIIDALDYTNKFFKWMYPKTYLFMVTYIPTIWGFFYYCLDFRCAYPLVRFIRRIVNGNNTKSFEEFLYNFKPDIVITTHFLASEVIATLKRQNRLQTKLITCVTDFRMHSFWFSNETDFFCVGFYETKEDLVKKWGIPAQKINILGIPIHPKFYDVKHKTEICNKLGLSKDLLTVLVTGGGFGVGPITGLVKALMKIPEALQILVICGHNEKLRAKVNNLITYNLQLTTVIKTYGFIDYVDELMAVADIGITKAGGLICSEALARELPLVIIAPIPGQESRNCKLLLANKAAFKISRPMRIRKIIKKIYYNKNMLAVMRENIKRIKKENPAINIAKFVINEKN